jgi:spermidine synthase
MALVWQKNIGDKQYQVRRAGASIRLYTDGVFHSQFNSNHPLSGSIWDLLVLPALFAPMDIRRVLVLGLGGGAVVRTLQALLPGRHITAVEIDPIHIQVALKYFAVRPNRHTKLIEMDAITWLKHYRGETFDFIIDDLFIEADGAPNRAVSANQTWCNLLTKQLAPKGILTVNFDSNKILRTSALVEQAKFSRLFASRFILSTPGYENRVAAFFKSSQTQANLKTTLRQLEAHQGKALTRRFNASIRKF